MIMIVIMVAGVASVLVGTLSTSALKSARQEKTSAALAQAKDALIGYAITYGDTHPGEVHGYLPCPDIDGNGSGNPEGSSELACGNKNVSSIGRLPWKTLDLPPLRDSDGECLWYAVSGTYKNNPKTDLMNWDNNGLFEILDSSGAPIAQNVVAVIFAPGAVLDNQNRAADSNAPLCGGNFTAINYLDSDGTINNAAVSGTSNAISQFRAGITLHTNDQFIFITKDDIFNARNLTAKLNTMTLEVAKCIAFFGTRNNSGGSPNPNNKSLPWPAQISLTDYADILLYNDRVNLFAGRVPYKVNTARDTSSNSISNKFLLQSDGANCPGWAAIYPWWDNWKDHLFYALGERFEPGTGNTGSCSSTSCLKINGSGNYAAVVMFAGKKLSSQSRANKSVVPDYLESSNASNFSSADGDESYTTAVTSSSTFNDILYCIDTNLNVNPCPPPP